VEEAAHGLSVRRREKDRLHTLQLLPEAWPERRRRGRRANHALTEALGAERDARLLLARLNRAPIDRLVRKVARRRMRKHVSRLRRHADALGERLHRRGA
jgi:hypothetical protein